MAKTTKPAAKKRPPKLRQKHLPGCEPPRLPALDSAAETYYDAIRERLPYTQAEKEAKEELIRQFHIHTKELDGATRYETPDGLVVILTAKDAIKVDRKKEPESNGEAE